MHDRTADRTGPARCQGNRQARGRCRADAEVRIAVRLVRELSERDRLAELRQRQTLNEAGCDRGRMAEAVRHVALPEGRCGAATTPGDHGAIALQGEAVS